MNRILPDHQFFFKGELTTSAASLNTGPVNPAYIKQIILTNIGADDVTVTLTSGESSPATEATIVVSGRDQWTRTYDQGWEFTQGIRGSASANSAIRAQIWGYQKSS
jgi:hypothetical protein